MSELLTGNSAEHSKTLAAGHNVSQGVGAERKKGSTNEKKIQDPEYHITSGGFYEGYVTDGDTSLAESFSDFIDFALVLQQSLQTGITKLLAQIAKKTETISEEMNRQLQVDVQNMQEDNKEGNHDQFALDQQKYNQDQQYYSNLLQQYGSIRDRTTQTISGINSNTSNLYSGLKSFFGIYTRI